MVHSPDPFKSGVVPVVSLTGSHFALGSMVHIRGHVAQAPVPLQHAPEQLYFQAKYIAFMVAELGFVK